ADLELGTRAWPNRESRIEPATRRPLAGSKPPQYDRTRSREEQPMTGQTPPARTPGAKRAGPGEYLFDLARVNHIKGGPDYSSVEGGVVEGDRMILALMRIQA